MIELKLEPYCQNCSGFEAETQRQILFSGADICEVMTTVLCKNASKCARLYDYIQRNMPNRCQENSPLKEHDGCIYNKSQDGQIKGRRMTDAESMGILFDDPPDVPYDAITQRGKRMAII